MTKTKNEFLLSDLEKLNDDQLKTVRDSIDATLHSHEEKNKKLNLINLTSVSAPLSGLFTPAKNADNEKKAAELLGYVKKADYSAIETVSGKYPTFMFMQVKDVDNKIISPLQKAFELYDTYTWKMLYEKIKDQPELVKKFAEQAHEQKEHINLKPLFDAYTAFTVQVQLWLEKKISNTQIDADWLQLGKIQCELLPTHMLREFCRMGDSWDQTSAFDTKQLPMPKGGSVFNYSNGSFMNLDDNRFSAGFGSSFSLVRGAHTDAGCLHFNLSLWSHSPVFPATSFDSATFSRLYEVRANDLANQMKLLDQSFEQSPTYKK